MGDGVRVWEVRDDDSLGELTFANMNREERIEKWITQNVLLLAPDESKLLVIGRQVKTDFGKIIDLLCMTPDGDLVIVELKGDKTPREVTAQALELCILGAGFGREPDRNHCGRLLKNNA